MSCIQVIVSRSWLYWWTVSTFVLKWPHEEQLPRDPIIETHRLFMSDAASALTISTPWRLVCPDASTDMNLPLLWRLVWPDASFSLTPRLKWSLICHDTFSALTPSLPLYGFCPYVSFSLTLPLLLCLLRLEAFSAPFLVLPQQFSHPNGSSVLTPFLP